MMHIARMASLILAFHLLTSAATAYAECAWVLWPKRLNGDFVQSLLVYDTRQQCESSLKDVIKSWDPKEEENWPKDVRRAHPSHWHCLPDTIDPRGPKGGAAR